MIIIRINGISVEARQYIGTGPLRVETGRGEVNAHSTDFILTWPDGLKSVVSELTLEELDLHQPDADKLPVSKLLVFDRDEHGTLVESAAHVKKREDAEAKEAKRLKDIADAQEKERRAASGRPPLAKHVETAAEKAQRLANETPQEKADRLAAEKVAADLAAHPLNKPTSVKTADAGGF
jgi:hypothetical protein